MFGNTLLMEGIILKNIKIIFFCFQIVLSRTIFKYSNHTICNGMLVMQIRDRDGWSESLEWGIVGFWSVWFRIGFGFSKLCKVSIKLSDGFFFFCGFLRLRNDGIMVLKWKKSIWKVFDRCWEKFGYGKLRRRNGLKE